VSPDFPAGAELETEPGYTLRALGEISERQSPVSPSQQPIFSRQRGHWNVPCRHSISVPQRRQISTYLSAVCALTGRR
jgi:hypothetical protein